MALPEAVRRGAEQANNFIQNGYADENTDKSALKTDDPNLEKKELEVQPPKTDPTKTESNEGEKKPEEKKTEAQPAASEETWEQRYKTLQGKFNHEVPPLLQKVKDLEKRLENAGGNGAEVAQLKARVTELQQQIESGSQPTGSDAVGMSKEELDNLRHDHGADLVDGMIRLFEGRLQSSINPLAQQVKTIDQSSQQTRAEVNSTSNTSRLSERLKRENLDLTTMNNDQFFIDWLGNPDGFSGVSRKQLLNEAFRSGDTERAARFFIAYSQEVNPTKSANKTNPADLNKHVIVQSNSNDSPNQGEESVALAKWQIEQQITDLYSKQRRREISPEEFAKLEKELFASLARYTKS